LHLIWTVSLSLVLGTHIGTVGRQTDGHAVFALDFSNH